MVYTCCTCGLDCSHRVITEEEWEQFDFLTGAEGPFPLKCLQNMALYLRRVSEYHGFVTFFARVNQRTGLITTVGAAVDPSSTPEKPLWSGMPYSAGARTLKLYWNRAVESKLGHMDLSEEQKAYAAGNLNALRAATATLNIEADTNIMTVTTALGHKAPGSLKHSQRISTQ